MTAIPSTNAKGVIADIPIPSLSSLPSLALLSSLSSHRCYCITTGYNCLSHSPNCYHYTVPSVSLLSSLSLLPPHSSLLYVYVYVVTVITVVSIITVISVITAIYITAITAIIISDVIDISSAKSKLLMLLSKIIETYVVSSSNYDATTVWY